MALELMDEHERGESVRAWLRQNGSAIVSGVVLGIAFLVAWQWWGNSKVEHRITAATQYQTLADAVERKDTEMVVALSDDLAAKYSDTPYAAFAALQLADIRLGEGDKAAAAQALERAAGLSKEPAFTSLVNLRRARVLLSSGDADGALSVADSIDADLYPGLLAELRGDAQQSLGREEEARKSYETALDTLDTGAPNRRIVEMKLADLGGGTEQPEV